LSPATGIERLWARSAPCTVLKFRYTSEGWRHDFLIGFGGAWEVEVLAGCQTVVTVDGSIDVVTEGRTTVLTEGNRKPVEVVGSRGWWAGRGLRAPCRPTGRGEASRKARRILSRRHTRATSLIVPPWRTYARPKTPMP